MTTHPEVRIFYAGLLDRRESQILADHYKRPMLPSDEVKSKVAEYRVEWKKYEHRLLSFLCDTLGLQFYRDVLDVHVAQFFIPKSEPLMINTIYEPDHFVDTLAHELTHTLLVDNNLVQNMGDLKTVDLGQRWKQLFDVDFSFTTIVHIPVHAVMAKVFAEFFDDNTRKERDMRWIDHFGAEDYKISWDYVDKIGYQNIIDMLKEDYKKIMTELAGAR